MAQIRPFAGIRYDKKLGADLSALIAPPYDVLDEPQKAALQAKHANNIVTVDLPFMPPKSVGPDAVYANADATIQQWMTAGVLKKDARAALYPYMQTYDLGGRTHHRRGFIGLVKLTPFGVDVMPHEKTYKGPIEDRLKLMHATGLQLSPIFGLYSDQKNEVTAALFKNLIKPEQTATLDGVKNDLWSVTDSHIETEVIDLMKHRPVYIADGHHRYTTALQYQADMEKKNGGKLPPNHPANFCMFVLIAMQDDGLIILPTHRLIGGLTNFDVAAFKSAVGANFEITETPAGADPSAELNKIVNGLDPHVFGLYDGKTRKLFSMKLKNLDVLKPLEPGQSEAWRHLDVAVLQRYLLDEILQPKFAGGQELVKGYTADMNAVIPQVNSGKYQAALLLKSTPLHALEELAKVGEVMPQKSTYFFPKLATGLVMNPLR
ncbi:DUF1015 domain-containing protein [soil metagenome]